MEQTVNLPEEVSVKGKELVSKGLMLLENQDYTGAKNIILEARDLFKKNNSTKGLSICLSLIGMVEYLSDKNNYSKALALIHDGTSMAEICKDRTAKLFNELSLGNINFCERNNDVALMHYENAKNIGIKNDEYSLVGYILTRIKQIKSGLEFTLPIKSDPLVSLVKIDVQLMHLLILTSC